MHLFIRAPFAYAACQALSLQQRNGGESYRSAQPAARTPTSGRNLGDGLCRNSTAAARVDDRFRCPRLGVHCSKTYSARRSTGAPTSASRPEWPLRQSELDAVAA